MLLIHIVLQSFVLIVSMFWFYYVYHIVSCSCYVMVSMFMQYFKHNTHAAANNVNPSSGDERAKIPHHNSTTILRLLFGRKPQSRFLNPRHIHALTIQEPRTKFWKLMYLTVLVSIPPHWKWRDIYCYPSPSRTSIRLSCLIFDTRCLNETLHTLALSLDGVPSTTFRYMWFKVKATVTVKCRNQLYSPPG